MKMYELQKTNNAGIMFYEQH